MFVDIILPLAIAPLTYSVPLALQGSVHEGCRVAVQLGKRKIYAGIIYNIHHNKPKDYEVKDILSVIDGIPLVSSMQLKFWQWMADYYLCTIGEVMVAALPAGLKMESETKLSFEQLPDNYNELSDMERCMLLALQEKKGATVEALSKIVGRKNIFTPLQSLLEKGLISADEQLKSSYKPKEEQYIRLHPNINSDERLNEVVASLRRAKKQEELLLHYVSLADFIDPANPPLIKKKELLAEKPELQAALKSCIDKGILQQIAVTTSRLSAYSDELQPMAELNEPQQKALEQIKAIFEAKDVALLHGVTSSGKTELYLQLIEEQLQQGKQVLYLLPEIALTVQIINRLCAVFGNRVGVYHSRYNNRERVEIYQSLGKQYDVIIGARSSVFLPFQNLGLVIVDEEHESSYKQQDPAPRYHARDVAIMLAHLHGAKTLLGTATPSIESYYNAQTGKYGLVMLTERFGDARLPIVETVNMLSARKKNRIVGHFSQQLVEEMTACVEQKEQVILFQNRRGFSPFIQCNDCGYIPQCKYCNVSLTYHKQSAQLRCHYCGYSIPMPNACSSCGSAAMETKGFGTEKVEEELSYILKDATIRRLDLDAARSRSAYEETIASFERGETDVLVGTQMVTKGLDFDRVSLVGILNADNMLSFPDFRAHERSFQLMMQVCGRAGRRQKQGKALIQTSNPSHPIIRQVVKHDYETMYHSQLKDRKDFCYPPFFRLISITLKHRDASTVNAAAAELASIMRFKFGTRVLGPQAPIVNRVQNKYINSILLKLDRAGAVHEAKQVLLKCIAAIKATPKYKSVVVQPDVDP